MIITRTPFRISLFGGGTDYPEWYKENGGAVLATAIDKYCYITCRKMPEFFDRRYRLMYSKVENTVMVDEIQHPVVREAIKYLGIPYGLEIHHDADLPARSGAGASSAFTVGFLNALYTIDNRSVSQTKLAEDAIHIERDIVGDIVGSQDQITVAYGGFNEIQFLKGEGIRVIPVGVNDEKKKELEDRLLLFHTRKYRYATDIASTIKFPQRNMESIAALPSMAVDFIQTRSWRSFGELMDYSWMLKKEMSGAISNHEIDDIYAAAKSAGAIGGKVIGAGAGGFILFVVDPKDHQAVKNRLSSLVHVPFKFESRGTGVIFNNE